MAEFSAKTPAARTAPGPAQRLNYILQRLAELLLGFFHLFGEFGPILLERLGRKIALTADDLHGRASGYAEHAGVASLRKFAGKLQQLCV